MKSLLTLILKEKGEGLMKKYANFGVMIATSSIIMYGLMYLNVFQLEYAVFSETRLTWG